MENTHKIVPFADEAAMAQLAYSRWEQAHAEDMAEYVYRRRTHDLASLAHDAVAEVLSEQQQKMIRLRYYENRTPTEIAKQEGVHLSTVLHTLDRAEEKLRAHLKYVVQYQHGLRDVSFLPLAVREALAVSAARYRVTDTLPERLRALREGEHLSAASTADAVQIPQARYALLESGQALPDAQELLRIAAFYAVSVDTLLKGGAA